MLSGVEPLGCRRDALKLNYFHRLRNSDKKLIRNVLANQVKHVRLVNAFGGHVSKFEQKNTSEWVSRNVLGFGGIIRVILNNTEFYMSSIWKVLIHALNFAPMSKK